MASEDVGMGGAGEDIGRQENAVNCNSGEATATWGKDAVMLESRAVSAAMEAGDGRGNVAHAALSFHEALTRTHELCEDVAERCLFALGSVLGLPFSELNEILDEREALPWLRPHKEEAANTAAAAPAPTDSCDSTSQLDDGSRLYPTLTAATDADDGHSGVLMGPTCCECIATCVLPTTRRPVSAAPPRVCTPTWA